VVGTNAPPRACVREMESWFDKEKYKTICLFEHGKRVKTYTTANAEYSDKEDAKDAFWTAKQFGMPVTSVSVDGARFKKINGKLRRIAND